MELSLNDLPNNVIHVSGLDGIDLIGQHFKEDILNSSAMLWPPHTSA
jgi:hypothetical protein